MSVNAPISGAALARGLRSEFSNTYEQRYKTILDKMSPVIELGVASTLFEELFGYYETSPYPQHRNWHDEVPFEAFRARNYKVKNRSWDIAVQWFQYQRLFDQLRDLERVARRAGENFATLPERVAFQIMTGTTDPDLLPVIPTAPDGAAMFATLAGGVDRFGVTSGNLLSGTGVLTAAAIRADFHSGLEQWVLMQDTKGQPLLDPGMVDQGVTILFGAANLQVFREAFIQSLTLPGAVTGGDGAVSNIILEGGSTISLTPTQRITDDSWYMYLDKLDLKPIFEIVARPLQEWIEVSDNSDMSRRLQTEGLFFNTIRGYGLNLPFGALKISNS